MALWPVMIFFDPDDADAMYESNAGRVAIRVRDARRSHVICVIQCMQKLLTAYSV